MRLVSQEDDVAELKSRAFDLEQNFEQETFNSEMAVPIPRTRCISCSALPPLHVDRHHATYLEGQLSIWMAMAQLAAQRYPPAES